MPVAENYISILSNPNPPCNSSEKIPICSTKFQRSGNLTMHITDLKTLTTAVKSTVNLLFYSLIVVLNHLTYSPLTYVKSSRHIVLETNHEEH